MTESISVVSPLYRSTHTVEALITRLGAVLPALAAAWEIVLVDDHCPDDSGRAAAALVGPGDPVRIVLLDRNVGQLAAVNLGLAAATGDIVVIMDADLQDRPEDVATLVDGLRHGGAGVVTAGRSGRYTTAGRDRTARLFRRTRYLVTLGRVPADAGLFLAARRTVIERVLALDDPVMHPISGMARVGARIASVPIERVPRHVGTSGYTWRRRLAVATRALLSATPLFPLVRTVDRRRWRDPGQTWLRTGATTSP